MSKGGNMGFITELLDRTGKSIAMIGFATLCILLIIFALQQKYDWLQYALLIFSHFLSLMIGQVLKLEGGK